MKPSLLVLAALGVSAAPGSRRGKSSSHYTNLPHTSARKAVVARQQGDSPWGGAVQEGQGWTMVTGTAAVPAVSGQDPSAGAAIWVGIDGYSCQTAILQTGFTVWGDGRIETWYEWYPDQSYDYAVDLGVQPGHQLRMTVYADGTSGGNSTIENLGTGQSASQTFEGESASLCLADAEWIVEDFLSGGGSVPFADFGQVQFTNASASGGQGTVTPEGATVVEVTVNGQPHTQCSSDASGVQCQQEPTPDPVTTPAVFRSEMCDSESAMKQLRKQPPVSAKWTFAAAESRMKAEFHWSGHTTLLSDDVDKSHALHTLWEEVRGNLDQAFLPSETDAGRTLDMPKMKNLYQHIWARCHAAAEAYHAHGDYAAQLPLKSEVLTLRFALPAHQANSHVTYALNMLAACHALHLFQVAEQDPRAPERVQQERQTIARVYQTSREMYEVLELNLNLWRSNKEEVDEYLNKIKAKYDGMNGGPGQSEDLLVELGHVEAAVDDTLEMMQTCQLRFEEAQKKWWEAKQEYQVLEQPDEPPASSSADVEIDID